MCGFRPQTLHGHQMLALSNVTAECPRADAYGLSGIVAVLFCGMIMASYTRPNLSLHGDQITVGFFKTLATMAETFVFIYIGASLFLEKEAWGAGFSWDFLVSKSRARPTCFGGREHPHWYVMNRKVA